MSCFTEDFVNDLYEFLTNTLTKEKLTDLAELKRRDLIAKIKTSCANVPEYVCMKDDKRCVKNPPQDSYEYLVPNNEVTTCNFISAESALKANQTIPVDPTTLSASAVKYSAQISGFLFIEKRKCIRKSLKEHWCAISHDMMFLYTSDISRKCVRYICIKDYQGRPLIPSKLRKYYFFELISPGRPTFKFAVREEKELNKWIEAVNKSYEEHTKTDEIDGSAKTGTEMVWKFCNDQNTRSLPSIPGDEMQRRGRISRSKDFENDHKFNSLGTMRTLEEYDEPLLNPKRIDGKPEYELMAEIKDWNHHEDIKTFKMEQKPFVQLKKGGQEYYNVIGNESVRHPNKITGTTVKSEINDNEDIYQTINEGAEELYENC